MVRTSDEVVDLVPAPTAEERLQELTERAADIGTIPEYMNAHGTDLTVDVSRGGRGEITLQERTQSDPPKYKRVSGATFLSQNLWIEGKGFRERSEVVLNFDDMSGRGSNLRVSAWTESGDFIRQIPAFATPGTWRVTAYAPVEAVGESAPDDHRRTMELADQLTITISK